MSLAGRPPKDDGAKVTRVAMTHGWNDVVDEPYQPTPEQEKCPVRTRATQQWWAVVVRMPHCVLWTDGDWEFARATAIVHATFVASKGKTGAKELRDREVRLAMTEEGRRAMRIRYKKKEEAQQGDAPAPVTDFAQERRRRLAASE